MTELQLKIVQKKYLDSVTEYMDGRTFTATSVDLAESKSSVDVISTWSLFFLLLSLFLSLFLHLLNYCFFCIPKLASF